MRCPHCSEPLTLHEWSASAPGEGAGVMQCRNAWCSASFRVVGSVRRMLDYRPSAPHAREGGSAAPCTPAALRYSPARARIARNITCPSCGGPTTIRSSRQLTKTAVEEYAYCITESCAGHFVTVKVLEAEISPSGCPKVRLPPYQPPVDAGAATPPVHATECNGSTPVDNPRLAIISAVNRLCIT